MNKRIEIVLSTIGFLGFIVSISLIVLLFTWSLPSRLNFQASSVVQYQDGQSAYVFLSEDDKWRIHADLKTIDKKYIDALISFEDQRFYFHPGVDPISILRAIYSNISTGRRVSGASTLTMQLVRVLEPRPRTFQSKFIEIYRAFQLECYLSKKEILEAYLRYIPFGKNIEGIEAATLSYFGHSAEYLSLEEISILLAIPQNPNARYPRTNNEKRLRIARDRIAVAILENKELTSKVKLLTNKDVEARLSRIQQSKVPTQLISFPREIPHLAFWLKKKEKQKLFFRTTIDRGTQKMAERILESRREDANLHGIYNASVVVVEKENNNILALVGNFSFDKNRGSQLPGFAIQRSTGSVLKPFIAAAAIESGLVLPSTLTFDIPKTFGRYAPTNYDKKFNGLVSVEEALARSLNLPFVNMLNEIGVGTFLGVLGDLGVQNILEEPDYYGLSAAVGGVASSPLEIASLYTSLSKDGRDQKLRFLQEQSFASNGLPVFSSGSAFLVRKMLRENDRPGFDRRRMNPNSTPIFWKTGTSYGFRDAWAAGASSEYVAVVWMGNMDNSGIHDLLASRRSGPVLFDILETLGADIRSEDPRPKGLSTIEVCAYSGLAPNDACPHVRHVDALSDRVPTRKCSFHRRVDIEKSTGRALVPSCRAGREYESKVFLSLPSSVHRYVKDRQHFQSKVPALAEHCRETFSQKAPIIISPEKRNLKLIEGMARSRQKLPLEAETEGVGVKLSWFIDGEFIGSGNSEEQIWWTPEKGEHEILVMDGRGGSARRTIKVY